MSDSEQCSEPTPALPNFDSGEPNLLILVNFSCELGQKMAR